MKHGPLRRVPALLLAAFVLLVTSCSQEPLRLPEEQPVEEPTEEPREEPPADDPAAATFTVAASGDISCAPGMATTEATCRMRDTAQLVRAADPDAVLVLGDAQYEEGTLQSFRQSYDEYWGEFIDITHPVPGNHEYKTPGAEGYFAYFGERVGDPDQSWYAFDLGGWRLYALDSNCDEIGGCGPGTPQYEWLKSDLEERDSRCVLAYWHHPRFSSSSHGDAIEMEAIWSLLHEYGGELVLAGHDHSYERFVPIGAGGEPADDGIREFVVGTGGRHLYEISETRSGSAVTYDETFGVLVLELSPGGYSWHFAATEGDPSRDHGEARCH